MSNYATDRLESVTTSRMRKRRPFWQRPVRMTYRRWVLVRAAYFLLGSMLGRWLL